MFQCHWLCFLHGIPCEGCVDRRLYLSPPFGRFLSSIACIYIYIQSYSAKFGNLSRTFAKERRKMRASFAKGPGPFVKGWPIPISITDSCSCLSKLTNWHKKVAAWVPWMFTHTSSLQTHTYSSHFPREIPTKDDNARIRARKQKWWSRKYRERFCRFCERGNEMVIWFWAPLMCFHVFLQMADTTAPRSS